MGLFTLQKCYYKTIDHLVCSWKLNFTNLTLNSREMTYMLGHHTVLRILGWMFTDWNYNASFNQ